jgi:hypothetical protein
MPTRIQWSRSGTDTTQLLVRLPVEAKAEIAELARRKGTSQTAVVLDALYRYMQAERVLAQAKRAGK